MVPDARVTAPADARGASRLGRLAIVAIFAAALIAFFALGGPRYLDLQTIQANRDALLAFTAQHRLGSAVLAFVLYTAAIALSLPGALVLSLTMGLLFGRWLGTLLVVLAATSGATIVFLAARYVFADAARRRLGGWGRRIDEGFAAHAWSYLLFIRLVPAFPFFLVNLACALTTIPLSTYVIATLVGIIPGTFVFTNIGETLGRLTSTRDLLSPATLIALALLGVFALMPVAWNAWKARRPRA